MSSPIDATDHSWYQHSVFYEVLVQGFFDSTNDGTGDLEGLTQKLDYLEWLGVDCLWLLPFYQSPLRDGGYDIADFLTVLPEYGNIDDAAQLIDQAHRRGIRVIADMVMNHTSDEHPWFQESRQDATNPRADWYVWNDDDHKWPEARVIFVDSEPSNWAFDPQRGQYYWHRFFHHQPDLNYANPAVQEAMLDVVRFWLGLGLDGFRLDAVPYLFERDGTNGENLPETHDYLRRLRKSVDAEFPGKVLLAEANQWPEDVVDYYGDGDECHMCFNFPLMPRMFMAIRREQRHPITEILAQTPEIPDGCQWGLFLRNHDELTLEMVSDEERDYMYVEYAKDPRMRRNIGIARRLFPLLENDRRVAELFHALLFSMPGSPVMYYGDELGMGDNIYLGDRDGVRTPMQWTPDRNGGFSRADFAQLYLPPLMDPVYGYHAVNVEAEQRDPSSFLHWLRRLLQVRKQHPVFGTGVFEPLHAENPSVLAYLRRDPSDSDVMLCVNNLSRFPQPVELMLEHLAGKVPVELTGRVSFPPIGELPYFVTLAPYGFFWFSLIDPPAGEEGGTVIDCDALPALLPDHLARQRWSGAADQAITSVELDWCDLVDKGPPALAWVGATAHFADGRVQTYQLFLGARPADEEHDFLHGKERELVGESGDALVYDALIDPELAIEVLHFVDPQRHVEVRRPLVLEHSNSSVVYDEAIILKIFRRVESGPNPDVEIPRVLASLGVESVMAPLATLRRDDTDVAVLRHFLVGATDGWQLAHTSVRDVLASRLPPEECGGDFASDAERLGAILAGLQLGLARAFGVEPGDPGAWADDMVGHVDELARTASAVPFDADEVAARLAKLRDVGTAGATITVHGDLHLAQAMLADPGWYILDWEGEPSRRRDERFTRSSPLRDVAGMLRSFHYATATSLAEWDEDDGELLDLAAAWEQRNRAAFLSGYLTVDGIEDLLPSEGVDRDTVLSAFELDKAVYEVGYELGHRPELVPIPAGAVSRLLS